MKTKVVHLTFKEPYEGQTNLYFSSLKAIYDVVPQEAVGIRYKSLTNAIRGKERYENKKVIIRIGELIRKANSKTKDEQRLNLSF